MMRHCRHFLFFLAILSGASFYLSLSYIVQTPLRIVGMRIAPLKSWSGSMLPNVLDIPRTVHIDSSVLPHRIPLFPSKVTITAMSVLPLVFMQSQNLLETLKLKCNPLIDGSICTLTKNEHMHRLSAPKDDSDYTWKSCTIIAKSAISKKYVKITLQMSGVFARLQVPAGQQIILCGLDESDMPIKESYFPIYQGSSSNMVEVIVKCNDGSTEEKIANSPIGSKMAIRLGCIHPIRLSPVMRNPINSFSIIATGRGIVPALSVIRTIIADTNVPINSVELLWINSAKELFLLNREVEDLEHEYRTRLRVTRIVDEKVSDSSVTLNERVQSVLSPFRLGRIGVIFSPASMLSKFTSFFVSLGFAVDKDIVSVLSP